MPTIYRYTFAEHVSLEAVRETFRLAHLATQSVYGRVRMLFEVDYDVINDGRTCWIDGRNDVGQHLHRVFLGYLRREIGSGALTIEEIDHVPHGEAVGALA